MKTKTSSHGKNSAIQGHRQRSPFRDNRPEKQVEAFCHLPTTDNEANGNHLTTQKLWQEETRSDGIIIHVDVKEDGKVWLQQDATDLVVADLLLEKGVAAEDLVLGFLTPMMRRIWRMLRLENAAPIER
ncbi:MAG: XisI protein [Saprospiraceae bacterium]|nr:XisI protein [Saprospiraceae bacterium]